MPVQPAVSLELERLSKRQDRIRIDALKIPAGPAQVPDATRIVIVSNEFFEAEAVWVRRSNVWTCSDADLQLAWMMGMERLDVKNELLRRGCRWKWPNHSKEQLPHPFVKA